MSEPTSCTWREDEDGNWHTSCEGCFVFNDGGPADNDMKFYRGYSSVHIVPTICAECGRVRNQWVNHSACAKARQRRFAAENAKREGKLCRT